MVRDDAVIAGRPACVSVWNGIRRGNHESHGRDEAEDMSAIELASACVMGVLLVALVACMLWCIVELVGDDERPRT